MLYVGDPMRHLATVGVLRLVAGLLGHQVPCISGSWQDLLWWGFIETVSPVSLVRCLLPVGVTRGIGKAEGGSWAGGWTALVLLIL